MNLSSASAAILQAFSAPSNGVLGLVDALLGVSREYPLRLDYQAGVCRVRLGASPTDAIDVPIGKSVVRAALARVAVLCNQREPYSVSPYGGRGKLVFADPCTVIAVTFANTPGEQTLELLAEAGAVPAPAAVLDAVESGAPTA